MDFQKSYAMTGWRLGYVCGNSILLDAMKKIHQYAIMCSPTTAQFAAIEALKNGDEVLLRWLRNTIEEEEFLLMDLENLD